MKILSASCISSNYSLNSALVSFISYANITALSAKLILALIRSSDTNGDPFINTTLGNLLMNSHTSVGFSGAKITIYWSSFRYLALSGNKKQQIEGWIPHTTIWLVISVESNIEMGVTLIRETGSGKSTQSVSSISVSSCISLPYIRGSSNLSLSSSSSSLFESYQFSLFISYRW